MRRLEVTVGKSYGFVSGYRARDLVVSVGGRPVWASITRAWSTSRRHALDAADLAENEGYAVTVTDERPQIPSEVIIAEVIITPDEVLW